MIGKRETGELKEVQEVAGTGFKRVVYRKSSN